MSNSTSTVYLCQLELSLTAGLQWAIAHRYLSSIRKEIPKTILRIRQIRAIVSGRAAA